MITKPAALIPRHQGLAAPLWGAVLAAALAGSALAGPALAAEGAAPELVRAEDGTLVERALLEYRRGRIADYRRDTNRLTVDTTTYAVPVGTRVLDPNGSVRSVDYLRRGMDVRFDYAEASRGKLPVITEVRVLDADTSLPES